MMRIPMLKRYDHFQNTALREFMESVSMYSCRMYASDLMQILSYNDSLLFAGVMRKALHFSSIMNIPIHQNFIPVYRFYREGVSKDYRLSELACRMIVISADSSFPNVAKMQSYFAGKSDG